MKVKVASIGRFCCFTVLIFLSAPMPTGLSQELTSTPSDVAEIRQGLEPQKPQDPTSSWKIPMYVTAGIFGIVLFSSLAIISVITIGPYIRKRYKSKKEPKKGQPQPTGGQATPTVYRRKPQTPAPTPTPTPQPSDSAEQEMDKTQSEAQPSNVPRKLETVRVDETASLSLTEQDEKLGRRYMVEHPIVAPSHILKPEVRAAGYRTAPKSG